ncbi:MAG TPA: hypothetical protein VMI54_04835 [Polyangiaceae bacterium]|nr:hypothetical protein [Polyangiaceae bacterium]
MQKSRRSSFSLTSCAALRAASALLIATSATGCVAQKHYDEARTAAESEAAAHERTRERLEASMQRISELESQLAERERTMAADESAVATSKLESTVAVKDKEAAVQLVEELRSELARTGDNLVLFARDKRDMAETLRVAEERMADVEIASKRLAELVLATRDLSLALDNELSQGTVELGARDGQIVLGVKADVLFDPSGDAVAPGADPVLAAVGKVSASHPTLHVVLREPTDVPASTRLQRLGEALRARGVASSRLVLPAARAEAPTANDAAPSGDAPAGDTAPKVPAPVAPSAAADPGPSGYEIAFSP